MRTDRGGRAWPVADSAKDRCADIAHFGNIRGSNDFKDHEIVIILGRDEPTVAAAEQQAMAIWYDAQEPIPRITPTTGAVSIIGPNRRVPNDDGTTKPGNVSVRPDP